MEVGGLERLHYLVVTPDPQDPQERDWFSYSVECPGVTEECRRWEDCVHNAVDVERLEEMADQGAPEPVLHGKRHRKIGGTWMAETDECYVARHDGLGDAVAGYYSAGRHPIGWDVGDGTELEVYDLR